MTDVEIGRLKATPLFTKEEKNNSSSKENLSSTSNKKITRYKATDLYAPNDVLRSLDMPIIDWPGKVKLRALSEEGIFLKSQLLVLKKFIIIAKFLTKLGLKNSIPCKELIDLIASSPAARRSLLLTYFIDNWKETYSRTYNPSNVHIAFLPSADDSNLYKPTDLFADSRLFFFKKKKKLLT